MFVHWNNHKVIDNVSNTNYSPYSSSRLSTSIAGSTAYPYFQVYSSSDCSKDCDTLWDGFPGTQWSYDANNPNAHLTVEFMTYIQNYANYKTWNVGFWDYWYLNALNANQVTIPVSVETVHHVAFVLQYEDYRNYTYNAYVDGVLTKTQTNRIVRSNGEGIRPIYQFGSNSNIRDYVQIWKVSTGQRYKGESFTAPTILNIN